MICNCYQFSSYTSSDDLVCYDCDNRYRYQSFLAPTTTYHVAHLSQKQYDIVADEWMQFLQDQYNPKCHQEPQNIPESTPSQWSSPSTEVPRAQRRTRVSLILSNHGQRPRLVSAPTNVSESAPMESQVPSSECDPIRQVPSRRTGTRSLSVSSSSSFTSMSSLSSWSSESDMEVEYELTYKNKVYAPSRKNKALPPPTLSPILVPITPQHTAAAAAFYSVKDASQSRLSLNSWLDDDSSVYSASNYGSDSDDESLSDSWSQGYHSQSDYDEPANTQPGKYMALSASIWGPGWHQVEPLPPSFIKAMQQTEQEAQERAQAEAQERAAKASTGSKSKAKKAKKQAKKQARLAADAATAAVDISEKGFSAADPLTEITPHSTTLAAASSVRLPRSLQFVDQ
ncbi:hypothetical protein BGZ80_004564 [Entomortierella chlamydospora]|uniref:Uncharacterized protein n=1 Tax=Entomortierella chlamydospora TaxID=101097 RepID=A0A9P6MMN2_9FUNG|nr:hypothetical protein BGZ79_008544 [Entomortierella chlamydospora]KAG0007528.1 hypothetical protein BGZ80_004564 [Entomortierella chlamydospora]